MFHTFNSQEDRRKQGGTSFVEIQFCTMAKDSATKQLVCVDNISRWRDDSLYVKDENLFYNEYRNIFDNGVYNNLESGVVDVIGINYYSPELTDGIVEKLHRCKPTGYEILLRWLEKSRNYNGFYILGL